MALTEHLASMVEEVSAGLPAVSRARMFGCDAFWANGNIYSLIWKDGRIGVKLTDPAAYSELMGQPGAGPWSPGGKVKMAGWVLVPESFHDDEDTLREWVRKAHGYAISAPPKVKGGGKKPAGVKAAPAKKRAAAPPQTRTLKKTVAVKRPAKTGSKARSGRG